MHDAAREGVPDEIAGHLTMGASVNERDRLGATPLMLAAAANPSPDVVHAFVQAGADVDAVDRDGTTALMRAARANPVPAVTEALLEVGADADGQDVHGYTALLWAATKRAPDGVVGALATATFAIDAVDHEGRTALCLVAAYALRSTVEILLAAGADPDARDEDGVGPLAQAAGLNPSAEAVAALLEAGAEVDAVGNGVTPLLAAAACERAPGESYDAVRRLLVAGAGASVRSDRGHRPLHGAVLGSDPGGVIRLLTNAGARLDVVDDRGLTPWWLALEQDAGRAVLVALLNAGQDPDERSLDGRTALHVAAGRCDAALVRALLRAGADPGALDALGKTPAQIAASRPGGLEEVLALLREPGRALRDRPFG